MPKPGDYWQVENLTADQGFSVKIPEFNVPPGTEVQDCYFLKVPDINHGGEIWVQRYLTALNPGSHHMNVFRVRTIVNLKPYGEDGRPAGEPVKIGDLEAWVIRGGAPGSNDCWKSANWADWPVVANSQNSRPDDPYTDFALPEGVAAKFMPGELLMLQAHYVNATTQKTLSKAKLAVNFYKFTKNTTPIELGTVFATQQSIRVCQSNPAPRYAGACPLASDVPVTLIAANGHFHSRGRKFDIYAWDGRTDTQPPEAQHFYESTSWDDPPMKRGLEVTIPANGGIYWSCQFQWLQPSTGCDALNMRDKQHESDCCYTFGPLVETSEHCNAFGYYYPKGVSDIYCN